MKPTSETDLQFLARCLWQLSPLGLSDDDSDRLYALADSDTPAKEVAKTSALDRAQELLRNWKAAAGSDYEAASIIWEATEEGFNVCLEYRGTKGIPALVEVVGLDAVTVACEAMSETPWAMTEEEER